VLAAGILANLGFEDIGADLVVVAAVALVAVGLLWRQGPRLLHVYLAVAYSLGLTGSLVLQLLRQA
jgi:hypothetical protein